MSVFSSCAWRISARSWEFVKTGLIWKRTNCLKPLTCLMFETSQRYHISFYLIQCSTNYTVHSYSSHYGRNQKREQSPHESSLQLADTHIQEVAWFFLFFFIEVAEWMHEFSISQVSFTFSAEQLQHSSGKCSTLEMCACFICIYKVRGCGVFKNNMSKHKVEP